MQIAVDKLSQLDVKENLANLSLEYSVQEVLGALEDYISLCLLPDQEQIKNIGGFIRTRIRKVRHGQAFLATAKKTLF